MNAIRLSFFTISLFFNKTLPFSGNTSFFKIDDKFSIIELSLSRITIVSPFLTVIFKLFNLS